MEKRNGFEPDLGFELVTVHVPGLLQVIHWGDSIDRSTTRGSSQDLVDNRAPNVLDFVATPSAMVTKINQLAHLQRSVTYSLIMTLFTTFSSHQQSLTSIAKSHLKSGLVLDQPVLNLPRHWVLDTTQKEIDGKPGFPTKHQKKW